MQMTRAIDYIVRRLDDAMIGIPMDAQRLTLLTPLPSRYAPSRTYFRVRNAENRAPTKCYAEKRNSELQTTSAIVQTEDRSTAPSNDRESQEYDAIVIGAGMGGLTVATQLASRGQSVLLLEKYVIPGGSAGYYERKGYTFDVGSSMMFGMGTEGTTNLITKALEAVGKKMETIPDPTQIHYHLPSSPAHPDGLEVFVWRKYERFVEDLAKQFPHEADGIQRFYDECWVVFNALNVLELKSLEEPRYLLGQFAKQPIACLQLAARVFANTGEIARKFIKDEELLKFIDMECFCWSTVPADFTPLINAGMVFCDRHFGGINYPKGGVGRIALNLAEGFEEMGGKIVYRANVQSILTEDDADGDITRAIGVQLANGQIYKGKAIISNATRWDTFEMLGAKPLPKSEVRFRQRYKKAPSFLTLHLGVRSDVIPPGSHCHHIVLEDWSKLEEPRGTLFVSIPTLLDPSLAPEGCHIFHAFTPEWLDAWKGLDPLAYEAQKEEVASNVIERLDKVFPGLKDGVVFKEVATPRTHRRFLGRSDGTYGPIPSQKPAGMMTMPFNRTSVKGLYCVGDSTFPGQGVNAVVFSGFGCAHRVLCDLGQEPTLPFVDNAFTAFLDAIRAST